MCKLEKELRNLFIFIITAGIALILIFWVFNLILALFPTIAGIIGVIACALTNGGRGGVYDHTSKKKKEEHKKEMQKAIGEKWFGNSDE